MSYKHKYYKYKQKYMNLLYGGANNKIVIRHKSTGKTITSLPFKRNVNYVDKDIFIFILPLVETMDEYTKKRLETLLAQAPNIQEPDKLRAEIGKGDKENKDPQYNALLQQKQEIEKKIKSISDVILKYLLSYFIANFNIVIDGIHRYTFHSYVTMGGQGIVFRIIKSDTREHHIIKFAIYYNCDEIKHEAETLEAYYGTHTEPTTFRPYKPLLYHNGPVGASAMGVGAMGVGAMGVGAMGVGADIDASAMDVGVDVRSMCFAIYEDVGNEDLFTFIRKCNDLRTINPLHPELVDRIKMIPHILLQIALQLEYYKEYRHNDIRLENIVVDVRNVAVEHGEQDDLMGQDEPVRTTLPIYKGDALELVRVTIIDFGKFDKPENVNFSLAYIASPEALTQEFIGTSTDKQKADFIGFCWVAIDLLTLSQAGYSIIEQTLIEQVLSNKQNHEIIALGLGTTESIKKKALLFIYQLLMHTSLVESPMSEIFEGTVIDTEITFSKLLELTKKHYKKEILQILFQNDKTSYNSFINNLLTLLASVDNRPNIRQLKNTLKQFVNTTSLQSP